VVQHKEQAEQLKEHVEQSKGTSETTQGTSGTAQLLFSLLIYSLIYLTLVSYSAISN